MFPKEWSARYGEAEIQVESIGLLAKLRVNGDMRDITPFFFSFSFDSPLLSAHLTCHDKTSPLIEVYFKTGFGRVKMKILVNGEFVGGDDF